jgi:predicted 2-oxoglutarate/Fe(II)-dependent dioxygenase YbiX
MEILELQKYGYAKLIKKALSPEECDMLINRANREKWKDALVNDDGKQVRDVEYRNSQRVMLKDSMCTNIILNKVEEYIPPMFGPEHMGTEVESDDFIPMPFVGLNPLLRFQKYTQGQYFKPHQDAEIEFEDGTCTILTVQMYLNDDFEGGELVFYDRMDGDIIYKYTPQKGDVLIFDGLIWHEGCIVTNGIKYAARTEVVYDPTKQVVQIPQIPQLKDYGFAKLLPKILSNEDCDMMMMIAFQKPWENIFIIDEGESKRDYRFENCKHIMFDDRSRLMNTIIMDKIRGHLPVHFTPEHVGRHENKNFNLMKLDKLNVFVRFFQYGLKGSFYQHQDTGTAFEDDNKTVFTIQVYLNDDYEGGETTFHEQNGNILYTHKPKKGDVLIFYNKIWCKENVVRRGMKLSLCTGLTCTENFFKK